MDARTLVARNIRRIRVTRGLSQEASAVDAGIDRIYVCRVERNLENPIVLVLERLAEALKCKIADLFIHTGEGKIATLKAGRRKRKQAKYL
jgi:transcriptional regulator with XRE-family HTH domain